MFKNVFRPERLITSVVKQYEARLQHLIEKYYFPLNLTLPIMQGLFLMVVVHGISKQVVAEEPEAKEETSEGAKKIKPGDYKLEEVLNNPSFIRQPFCYVGDGWTGKEYVDDDILSRMLFTCFVDDMEETDNITEPLIANFSEWIDDRKREIQGYPQFRKEVQEDPHEVMLTGDNFNNKLDPFVSFMAAMIASQIIAY